MQTVERATYPFFFVTRWRLDTTIARAWDAIRASERYPEWWPNVRSVSSRAWAKSATGSAPRSSGGVGDGGETSFPRAAATK